MKFNILMFTTKKVLKPRYGKLSKVCIFYINLFSQTAQNVTFHFLRQSSYTENQLKLRGRLRGRVR